MANVVKHLRGTAEEWAAYDEVVPDGTLALLRLNGGGFRIKIGDGVNRFSALPYIDGNTVTGEGSEAAVVLSNGTDLRYGVLTSLTVDIPEQMPEDMLACISFDSAEEPTTVSYLFDGVRFSGDSVEDGVFVPESSTHYSLFFWYDGAMNCHARGVANE